MHADVCVDEQMKPVSQNLVCRGFNIAGDMMKNVAVRSNLLGQGVDFAFDIVTMYFKAMVIMVS